MRMFRLLAVLFVLLCLVPPAVLLASALTGRWTGCEADPNTQYVCQVGGIDYGGIIYALANFGANAGAAILLLGALLVSWGLIEIVQAIGRGPRKQQVLQTSANSRNRKRGS